LTEYGPVRQRTPSLVCLSHDPNFTKALQKSTVCFITFSLRDMCLLRRVGLAATTATGLATLGGKHFGRYPVVIGNQGAFTRAAPTISKIVLVGCGLSDFSTQEPAELMPVAAQLTRLSEVFELKECAIGIWRLNDESAVRLKFAIRHSTTFE